MEKELILKGIVDTEETEIELGAWHKKAGEAFEAGEILLEAIAGKENVDITLDAPGKLVKVLKDEYEIVSLEEPIAIIEQ